MAVYKSHLNTFGNNINVDGYCDSALFCHDHWRQNLLDYHRDTSYKKYDDEDNDDPHGPNTEMFLSPSPGLANDDNSAVLPAVMFNIKPSIQIFHLNQAIHLHLYLFLLPMKLMNQDGDLVDPRARTCY